MPATRQKLTAEQRQEVVAKTKSGATNRELAAEYGVCTSTIKKICRIHGARRPFNVRTACENFVEFQKRANSILWRQDQGKEKLTYEKFRARVAELQSADGGGLDHKQAVVRACKEYPCLHRLFREYDVRKYDPNSESHPEVKHFGTPTGKQSVINENKEQSYRENLAWAMAAAGEYLRTEKYPAIVPNDAAYYLFIQASENPKDFLSRVGQVESKGDGGLEEARLTKKAGSRSIAELDSMLQELQ